MLSSGEYEATFTTIDADADGLITAPELQALLSALGQPITADTANAMLGLIDSDGDGKVDRTELKAYLDRTESSS